jgi:hypothetical protein
MLFHNLYILSASYCFLANRAVLICNLQHFKRHCVVLWLKKKLNLNIQVQLIKMVICNIYIYIYIYIITILLLLSVDTNLLGVGGELL